MFTKKNKTVINILEQVKKEKFTLSACTHPKKAMGGHSEKVAICKPRREASSETFPVGP